MEIIVALLDFITFGSFKWDNKEMALSPNVQTLILDIRYEYTAFYKVRRKFTKQLEPPQFKTVEQPDFHGPLFLTFTPPHSLFSIK